MNASEPLPVLVGADGSMSGLRAVRYAALAASRIAVPLDIVHVTPSYVPMPPVRPVEPPALGNTALEILRIAAREARAAAPSVEVHTRLLTGSRVRTLAHASGQAQLVVLGSERRSDFARLWTGATGTEVSAHATCPVVVVPQEWENSRGAPEGRRRLQVLEALSRAPRQRLRHRGGASGRARHRARLEASLRLRRHHRVTGGRRGVPETLHRHDRASGQGSPHRVSRVPVRIEALHAQAAYALVAEAKDADLVLLMRSSSGALPSHLGRTARAVLRDAGCPVEVLVPAPSTGMR